MAVAAGPSVILALTRRAAAPHARRQFVSRGGFPVHKFLHRLERQSPSRGEGADPALTEEERQREPRETTAEGSGQAPVEHPDEVEELREGVEAVLAVAREAAGKVKTTAQAEAEATLEATTRKASEQLEKAEREATELRARAERALKEAQRAATKLRKTADEDAARSRREAETEASRILNDASAAAAQRTEAIERQTKVLGERFELTQERLREVANGLREIASHLEELVSSDAAIEIVDESELDESLREVAQASGRANDHSGDG
jgi:hypothetical protein